MASPFAHWASFWLLSSSALFLLLLTPSLLSEHRFQVFLVDWGLSRSPSDFSHQIGTAEAPKLRTEQQPLWDHSDCCDTQPQEPHNDQSLSVVILLLLLS